MRSKIDFLWFVAGALLMLVIMENHISAEVDRRVDLGLWAAQESDNIKAGSRANKN